METILFFHRFSVALSGLILYTIFSMRSDFVGGTFHIDTLVSRVQKKYAPLIWSFLMLLIVVGVITMEPTVAYSVKELLGLDLSDSISSYFTLGLGLMGLVDSNSGKTKTTEG